jgi:cyclic pyranopterin phosphate synthase
MPLDGFGRTIDYLRVSLIDHCNLRCVYCMPLSGLRFARSDELLSATELERVAGAAVAVGFRKIRLTGGEPTLRPDLVEIVQRLAHLPGLRDLSMTTNGISTEDGSMYQLGGWYTRRSYRKDPLWNIAHC